MSKEYKSSDISLLTDREHVRLRTQIYIGNMNKADFLLPNFINGKFAVKSETFVASAWKAILEVLDNSTDELLQIDNKRRIKTININADVINGEYTIRDNGRGIPIDLHETGKYTPEVALSSLRAGRNFGDTDIGVIGQNGVGSSCTNMCSTYFKVKIIRDGKEYNQLFENGCDVINEPLITKSNSKKTGTEISFKLDPIVFKNGIEIPDNLIHNKAIELAFTNPGLTVTYKQYIYKFKNGIIDLIPKFSKEYFTFNFGNMEFHTVFDIHKGIDEEMFTWVNSSLLLDGGICNTQFLNALSEKVIKHLAVSAKKEKTTITRNDVRQDLLIFGCLKISKPEYDSQSKTRLTGPNLRKDINEVINEHWKEFTKQNKGWLEGVLKRASSRHHANANKKAINAMSRHSRTKIVGLTDATSKNRSKCKLVITEGLSAAAMLTDVRDPLTIGSYPLTGKINNVFGCSPADIMKMGKLTNLLKSIGLIPGVKAHIPKLRFSKLYIATDSDPDGDDIFAILNCLFFSFWPELFNPNMKEPFIYRLLAPNVVASKGKKRIHFSNRNEYEKVKGKYRSFNIEYFKGLGSMWKEDWETILNGNGDSLLPIVDSGNMQDTLNLLFNDKLSDERKEWLQS
jgi:DNA gyrase/topoisomerase IV subunit B